MNDRQPMVCQPPDEYTYCSYATEEDGCRGVVILRGCYDVIEAARRARELGVSPGGQLIAIHITQADVPPHLLDNVLSHLDQLVSPEDAKRLFEDDFEDD